MDRRRLVSGCIVNISAEPKPAIWFIISGLYNYGDVTCSSGFERRSVCRICVATNLNDTLEVYATLYLQEIGPRSVRCSEPTTAINFWEKRKACDTNPPLPAPVIDTTATTSYAWVEPTPHKHKQYHQTGRNNLTQHGLNDSVLMIQRKCVLTVRI